MIRAWPARENEMPLTVEIVTVERKVLEESGIDEVIAPGVDGQLAVLPQHAAFMTMLAPGELILKKGVEEIPFAVTGGFFEVLKDKVIVLADAAERADEIDVVRAEAARERARLAIERRESTEDLAMAAAALQRALIRLRIAENRRRRASTVRR
jgi:F-type H+-transporting ATPase subunit epsilon